MEDILDTTLVNGTGRKVVADVDGVTLEAARKRKTRTCPELVGVHQRDHLVVIALEVGGWLTETGSFLSQLPKANLAGFLLEPKKNYRPELQGNLKQKQYLLRPMTWKVT